MEKLFVYSVASPALTAGVAAHVTHSRRPSERVIRLSFKGTPPLVILWETGGRCWETDTSPAKAYTVT